LVFSSRLRLLVPHVRPHLFDQARARLVYLESPRAQERRNVLNAVDHRIVRGPRANSVMAQLRDETRRRRVDPNPLRPHGSKPALQLRAELSVRQPPPLLLAIPAPLPADVEHSVLTEAEKEKHRR